MYLAIACVCVCVCDVCVYVCACKCVFICVIYKDAASHVRLSGTSVYLPYYMTTV